ncbi:hypothetical protein [Nocardia terpenica]|uniref:DUF3168 domain-containing protein n=1 Tax=Nocardia terpenica TaxID=455432 RepID=A0A164H1S8_9NOCA|nr:hypothetical protein [Nocardia terpenica]KZM68130.1 hypothetical protein AWN90_09315 [Nocardia terpenica]NQE89012.1 hypothetical protein [Nocardia terpenica]
MSETVPDAGYGAGRLSAAISERYPVPGAFLDWEQVCVDLLTPLAYTCSALPPDMQALDALLPLVLVRRVGGGLDVNAITDTALMQCTAFAPTRALSQQLASQVREALLACPGDQVNGVLVDYVEEMSGQLEVTDLDPLNRTVEVAFRMEARRQL